MKKIILIFILITSIANAKNEKIELFAKYKKETNSVMLKWVPRKYSSNYIYKVYRDKNLVATLKMKPYKEIVSKYSKDEVELAYPYKSTKTIEDRIQLSRDITQINGFRALYVLQHNSFAADLGQFYEDKDIKKGTTYTYTIKTLKNGAQFATNVIKIDTSKRYNSIIMWVDAKGYDWGVGLSWDIRNEFGMYNIYRKIDNAKFVRLNKEPFFSTSTYMKIMYRDKTLKPSQKASYYIKNIDVFEDEGVASKIVTASRKAKSLPTVQNIKIDITDKKIDIVWDAIANSTYDIYRSRIYQGGFVKINKSPLKTPKFSDTDFESNKNYYYYIKTIQNGKSSEPSTKILSYARDVTPPKAPKNLKATTKPGIVQLKWSKVTDKDLLEYRIYMSMDKNALQWIRVDVNGTSNTFYTHKRHKKLSRNFYYYRVVSVDQSFNESTPSNIIKVKLPDVTPPKAPQIIGYKVTIKGVELTYAKVSDFDTIKYNIYRAYKGKIKKLNKTPISKLSFLDTRPLFDKSATYTIKAIDSSKNISAPSNPVKITFKSPRIPKFNIGLKSIKKGIKVSILTKDKKITGFNLFRSEDGKNFYKVAYVKGRSYVDVEALSKGKKYYKVIVYNKRKKSAVKTKSIIR